MLFIAFELFSVASVTSLEFWSNTLPVSTILARASTTCSDPEESSVMVAFVSAMLLVMVLIPFTSSSNWSFAVRTSFALSSICRIISRTDLSICPEEDDVESASFRISSATTANPFPASPA